MPKIFLSESTKPVKDATAYAIARGGTVDGHILYYTDSLDNRGCDISEINLSKYIQQIKPVSEQRQLVPLIIRALKEKKTELDDSFTPSVRELYKTILNDAKQCSSSIIELPVGSTFEIVPNPDPKAREVIRISGMSGSGKSYFARSYAQNYRKLFPGRPIYLVSELQKDETLDNMIGGKPERISLNKLVEDELTLDEFEDNPCLIIFDDIDALRGAYSNAVYKLIDLLVSMGRHCVVSVIICAHNLTDYKKSKLQLAESHWIVLFPQAVSPKAMKYVLENYGGMSVDSISKCRTLGRWLAVKKTYPPIILSSYKSYLLNN